jgi:DNA-binding transcriptional LysR family regulator
LFLLKEEMWLVGTGKDTEMPKQISVSEITKYPLIFFSGEYPHFTSKMEAAMAAANVPLNPTFESTNVGTLKRVIESGLGWGFLPSLSITNAPPHPSSLQGPLSQFTALPAASKE